MKATWILANMFSNTGFLPVRRSWGSQKGNEEMNPYPCNMPKLGLDLGLGNGQPTSLGVRLHVESEERSRGKAGKRLQQTQPL